MEKREGKGLEEPGQAAAACGLSCGLASPLQRPAQHHQVAAVMDPLGSPFCLRVQSALDL